LATLDALTMALSDWEQNGGRDFAGGGDERSRATVFLVFFFSEDCLRYATGRKISKNKHFS
jgi:hypothetical protein